jgi:hypothetical protein
VPDSSAMRTWLCVLGIVNVSVEGTVEAGTKSKCFDRNGLGIELVRIAEVDEGMRDC